MMLCTFSKRFRFETKMVFNVAAKAFSYVFDYLTVALGPLRTVMVKNDGLTFDELVF